MGQKEQRVNSMAEYLAACAALVDRWSGSDSFEKSLWYRGHEGAAWSLLPGEYRHPLLDAEEMRSEFMLKAPPLLETVPRTDWEWYFLMQHYGLPTRLLDWTFGSLIGLHFALRSNPGSHDAAVWVLDPWSLNEWTTSRSDLMLTGGDFKPDPVALKYLRAVYDTRPLPARPIAVVPPYNSRRITAQRGAFTVHGKKEDGLEHQFRRHLAKIVIPRERALQMKRELRSVGINEFGLFPDLDGLCREIASLHVFGY